MLSPLILLSKLIAGQLKGRQTLRDCLAFTFRRSALLLVAWATVLPAASSGQLTFTEYPAPVSGSFPRQIVTGSDGNLWFTSSNIPGLCRITPSGVTTTFPVAASEG